MWAEFLAVGLSRRDYNMLTRPFSDLATLGAPHGLIFDLGFFLIPGVLTVVLGMGLYFTISGGQAWRAGAILVMAAGLFLLATGVFRQQSGSFVASALHGTMAQLCFAIASVAPLVLFVGSRDHVHFAPPRRLWLVGGIASFAIEGLAVAMRPVVHYPDGFFQRPFTLVLTIFFLATGAWLLRGRHIEGLLVPD
jgi:hypothetical protein